MIFPYIIIYLALSILIVILIATIKFYVKQYGRNSTNNPQGEKKEEENTL